MEFKLNKKEDYVVSKWSGGTTTQMGIYPAGELYADRNFIWRLSSATVDDEESDFTSLPDYNRILAVLDGEVVLTYDGKRTVKLHKLEFDYFDGASDTKSYGKITDYNLMTRKGYTGKLEVLKSGSESKSINVGAALTHGFFCKDGYAVISFEGNSVMVNDGEQLVVNDCPNMEVSYMGEGSIIHIEVFKNPGSDIDAPDKEAAKANEDPAAYPFRG